MRKRKKLQSEKANTPIRKKEQEEQINKKQTYKTARARSRSKTYWDLGT